ncbi:hypothetical protein KKF81_03955 [Candidatus Micrarchaeota archaeon]|nr:hypothetical protein [Candidatus Micrarchaeota archaeon]MBU1166079.1 hypothetical protein [Candidatus Micrarchaeota archaeon]MBU1886673.1 hypothetical protein [Candidatus Micrarchaeota archaeon]
MERPSLDRKEVMKPFENMKLIARTQTIQEAETISKQYEMQGFQTRIIKKEQGNIAIYEVWIGKKPDVFSAGK